ncbi:GNAT family protein [Robertmurraya sp. DFI.2.37]|jgi:diamine N-acetyltransferase|uniref:GNAT family N-acetyltransferase n=1 Tax=Robertmurraya sp. DFI.2.37 TaxID=3031819 RepID=UPI001248F5E2|nr:GNAT family protein [Robertmurraya sp. DFI.2.37]MDF1508748.1 GNAT family protein [Robertmurraya sp. DFI.2.37]
MINLSNKPTIEGKKVILRPFKEKDFPLIEECVKDPEVIKLTGSSANFDQQLFHHWYQTRNEQKDRLDLAVEDKRQANLVGEAVINLYDQKNHSMNFRILIGPRGRNRGLGTEATQLMIDYIFQNTDLNFLTLSVYDFNPRAKHVYEKVGFVTESVDRGELQFEGVAIDSINMKLTRENWLLRSF